MRRRKASESRIQVFRFGIGLVAWSESLSIVLREPRDKPEGQHIAEKQSMKGGAVMFECILNFCDISCSFRTILRTYPVPTVVSVRLPNNPSLAPVLKADVNVSRLRKHLRSLNVRDALDFCEQPRDRLGPDVRVLNLERSRSHAFLGENGVGFHADQLPRATAAGSVCASGSSNASTISVRPRIRPTRYRPHREGGQFPSESASPKPVTASMKD